EPRACVHTGGRSARADGESFGCTQSTAATGIESPGRDAAPAWRGAPPSMSPEVCRRKGASHRRQSTLRSGMRVIVPGGGACGMSAGYTLARAGACVTVLERERRVGGLCGTEERRGFRFDLGGHRFLSRSRALEQLVRDLVGDDLLLRTRSSVVLHGGV